MLNPAHISNAGDAIMAVMALVACVIVGSYPVIRIMGWWSEGTVEGGVAFIGILTFVGLLISAVMMPPVLAFTAIGLILLASAVLPIMSKFSDQRQLNQMEEDKYDKFASVLEKEPMDFPARLGLAEALHKRGQLKEAIEQLEWVLAAAPSLGLRIKPQLESWKRELGRVGQMALIFCHKCRAENPPMATHCIECHTAFGTRKGIKQGMDYDGGPVTIIRGWVVGSSMVLIVMFVVFCQLPSIVAGPIILGSIIVAIWLFLRWVGGDMGVTEG